MSTNNEQMVSVKKDTLTLAIENNPCGRCRVAGYPTCKCGGGGRESGDIDSNENKHEDAAQLSNQATNVSDQTVIAAIQQFEKAKTSFVQSELFSKPMTSYETDLLFIESDKVRGDLTFKIKEELSETELKISREFLLLVKAEFDGFTDKLEDRNLTKDFTVTLKGNELTIRIPNPKYYDAFINHLESVNLLPISNPNQQYKNEIKNTTSKPPSPFDGALKGPKPTGWE